MAKGPKESAEENVKPANVNPEADPQNGSPAVQGTENTAADGSGEKKEPEKNEPRPVEDILKDIGKSAGGVDLKQLNDELQREYARKIDEAMPGFLNGPKDYSREEQKKWFDENQLMYQLYSTLDKLEKNVIDNHIMKGMVYLRGLCEPFSDKIPEALKYDETSHKVVSNKNESRSAYRLLQSLDTKIHLKDEKLAARMTEKLSEIQECRNTGDTKKEKDLWKNLETNYAVEIAVKVSSFKRGPRTERGNQKMNDAAWMNDNRMMYQLFTCLKEAPEEVKQSSNFMKGLSRALDENKWIYKMAQEQDRIYTNTVKSEDSVSVPKTEAKPVNSEPKTEVKPKVSEPKTEVKPEVSVPKTSVKTEKSVEISEEEKAKAELRYRVNKSEMLNELRKMKKALDNMEHFYQSNSPSYVRFKTSLSSFIHGAKQLNKKDFQSGLDRIAVEANAYQVAHKDLSKLSGTQVERLGLMYDFMLKNQYFKEGERIDSPAVRRNAVAMRLTKEMIRSGDLGAGTPREIVTALTDIEKFNADVKKVYRSDTFRKHYSAGRDGSVPGENVSKKGALREQFKKIADHNGADRELFHEYARTLSQKQPETNRKSRSTGI